MCPFLGPAVCLAALSGRGAGGGLGCESQRLLPVLDVGLVG